MAEILGIVTGVVSVLDVSIRASTSLAKIIRVWKDRPVLLYALQNDISDLNITLDELRNTTNVLEKNTATSSTLVPALNCRLKAARRNLDELESLVHSLKNLSGVRRAIKWTNRQQEAIRIHERLRDVRTRIRELLIAHTASTVSKIELQILSIRQTHAAHNLDTTKRVEAVGDVISDLNRAPSSPTSDTEDVKLNDDVRNSKINDFLSQCSLEASTASLDPAQIKNQVDLPPGKSIPEYGGCTTIPASRQISLPASSTLSGSPSGATAESSSLTSESYTAFELQRWATKCDAECLCSCHSRRNYWSTSRVLQSVVGTLFLGYTGLPVLGTRCDVPETCRTNRNTSIHVRYMFPTWLFYRTLEIALRSSTSSFQFNIVVRPRIAWSYTNLFGLIDARNFDGVKQYVHQNPASVHTVWDRTCQSPLHFAVTSASVDVNIIRFLVQAGANPDTQSDFGLSAVQHVSLQIFRKVYSPQDEKEIQEIMPISISRGVDHEFSLLHKVVLGICPISLSTLLGSGDSSVILQMSHRDIFGNTPLHWASGFADLKAVHMLIECGSDVNIKNSTGKTPLLVAASIQNFDKTVEVIEVLIKHGGDPLLIPRDGWGPIHWACHYQNIPLIELLLRHGADLNHKSRRNGTTPLTQAAQKGRAELIKFLLDKGSDIDTKDFDGRTPLYHALSGGHYDTVQLLLSQNADYTTIDQLGKSVLHCAAERGDVRVMELLTSLQLQGLDIKLKNNRDMTAEDVFAYRGEKSNLEEEQNFSRREEVNYEQPVEKTKELEDTFRSLIAFVQSGQKDEEDEAFFDSLED